ncbi:MAG: uracil-DNA glycosylase [Alphaproteobacteria bacterium]|nr:uracil-DNA glycosylase [Alphaproteobacteria bacterium]
MSLSLDARQKAMLEHMGLRLDFLPVTSAPAAEAGAIAEPASTPNAPAPAPERAVGATPTLPPQTLTPASVPVARSDAATADWNQLQHIVRECQSCGLCESRRQTVFGVGAEPPSTPEEAGVDVMIVGEAPGEHEDLQGLPFMGAAGQLLDQMLAAVGWSRQPEGGPAGRVYIANVLKCRPPGNRNPQPEEVAQCLPLLQRQIELLRPRLLLAMGRFGAQALLTENQPDVHGIPLGKLRGLAHAYRGTPLIVTYHPAYLLRSPAEKSKAWNDLCLARSLVTGP